MLVLSPQCPRCQSTQYRNTPGAAAQDFPVKLWQRDGVSYNLKRIRRVICQDCDQQYARHEMHYLPPK